MCSSDLHAVEIRHESFKNERFVHLCRKHNIAIVFADSAGRYPYLEDVTADFIYCRLHGAEELYVSGYTDAALDWWAARIKLWRCGKEPGDRMCVSASKCHKRKARDVYVYFDNDAKVKAPFDAMRLAERLGGAAADACDEAIMATAGEAARESWPDIARYPGRGKATAKR